jgi:hypothetical protein
MESRTTTHEMGIVDRRHNTHHTRTTSIHMTEIITQSLQVINRQLVLIHEDRVVCRTRRPLKTRMGKEIVVVELRVTNVIVDNRAGHTVSGAIPLATVGGEEANVVTLRDDDKGDFGTVAFFEGLAGRADGFDFGFDDVCELTFGDTVAEEQDTFRLGFGLLVESLKSDGLSDGGGGP